MIPILYDYNETAFTSNGIGRLSSCIECKVTEERNGRYDLTFSYPVNGIHFEDIQEGRIIAVTHDEGGDLQPFVIYASSKPINGIVTFEAYHLSYRLGQYTGTYRDIAIYPDTLTVSEILAGLIQPARLGYNYEPWTSWTDVPGSVNSFNYYVHEVEPIASIREWLGGREGSVLDLFGGEYEFDKWEVKLHQSRGANNGVVIRYGKNLSDFKAETDFSGAYTHIKAVYNGDYKVNYNPGTDTGTVRETYDTGHRLPGNRVAYMVVDFSDKIENGKDLTMVQISNQLSTLAATYATINKPWEPSVSMEVDFVQLWQTEEFRNYAPLLRCKLCDTVNVSFGMYGLADLAIKVVSVEWDALRDRYIKMTLGGLATTLESAINSGLSGSVQAHGDAIQSLNGRTYVKDVQVNGSSVVTDGVAVLPDMLSQASQSATWSNVHAAASVGTYVTLKTFNLAAGKWLILMQNGNGQSSAVNCNIRGRVTSGTATVAGGVGFSNDTSGNCATGWFYVNATTTCTVTVDTYTYNTSVTNFNGGAAAIPIL